MNIYGNFINEVADKIVSINNKNIEKIFGFTNDNGYNALVQLSNFDGLLRGRSEMIVLNDKDEIFVEIKKDGSLKFPGGSWNKNEDHLAAARRETNEETRMDVKDIYYCGSYISKYYSTRQDNIPKKFRWIGTFTELYIAKQNGYYNKSIDKKDEDDIRWKGRFYPLSEISKSLSIYHKRAIDNYLLYKGDF